MTKIKKIVAAAIVAASVGTVGMTAFASSSDLPFDFVFTSSETDIYEHNGARKDNSWDDPARVKCQAGDFTNISSSRPVRFSVWDSNDPDYSFQMTPYVTATRTDYQYSLPYTLIMGRFVFLYGEGDVGTKVSGEWRP